MLRIFNVYSMIPNLRNSAGWGLFYIRCDILKLHFIRVLFKLIHIIDLWILILNAEKCIIIMVIVLKIPNELVRNSKL